MRVLALALLVSVNFAVPANAGPLRDSNDAFAALARLDRSRAAVFQFDAEMQAANLILSHRRVRFDIGITNMFQFPVQEPPGGVFLGEHTVLTEALSGFEVDTGSERVILLTFRFDWSTKS